MNSRENLKPLSGLRVIELAGLGPVPYAGQLLADMGAEVIAVARPGQSSKLVEDRGKRSVVLDLKKPGARDAVLTLVETADILTEGYRPGVTERLGLGPDDCKDRNPRLVYARMTGWGQYGPLSHSAGHDINYIGLTGALHAIGRHTDVPIPPINLLGDYGAGSLFLVTGVLAALHQASQSGEGATLDIAIVDGAVSLFGMMLSMYAESEWSTERESNWLDGSRPYYRCYRCLDDKFVAVGALEPQFFNNLLSGLNIDESVYGEQLDTSRHATQHEILEQAFLKRSRDDWSEHFASVDACVSPVLDFIEAAAHPHLQARQSFMHQDGVLQPNIAPRFSYLNSLHSMPPHTAVRGAQTREVLEEIGLPSLVIDELARSADAAQLEPKS